MALVAHQAQGYSALTIRPQPRSAGGNLRCFVVFHLGSTNKLTSLRHQFHVGGSPITLPKEKPLKVSSFKINGQHNESHDTSWDPKVSKNAVYLAYELQEREEILSVSPVMTSIELPSASENMEATAMKGPKAIQNLFRKWLTMLHSETLIETVDGIYTGRSVHAEISEREQVFLRQKAVNVMKATFLFFLRLDATIKTPLLIFIPWYLITRVVYGLEVAKELTPLWVVGPLITAVYIKLIGALSSVYMFFFKQSLRFLEMVPIYCMLIYSYAAEGKLQAFLSAHFCQPIVDVRNMDYNKMMRQKLTQLKEWSLENYLDYVESLWPYYCSTIRFLKKANLL